MKKAALGLALAALCVAGCLKIEADENAGSIDVSSGKVDVHQAIRQLMADRGWTSEREGARTSSASSVRTGIEVSTREGVKLPGKSRNERSHSYIYARTPENKIVQFDVARATGRPTEVRITIEPGAGVAVSEVTADLTRRLQRQAHGRQIEGPLAISIDMPVRESAEPNALTGTWTARGDWAYPSSHIQFEVLAEGGARRQHSVYIEGPAPWRVSGTSPDNERVSFRLERRPGVMLFEGLRLHDGGNGTATFEPNDAYIRDLAGLVNEQPDAGELLTLFFRDLDLNYARQIKQSLASELTLGSLLALDSYHVSADYVKGTREVGYAFPVEQIVKLHSYHVPLEGLQGFKRAGYGFSADELIRIRSYHVSVEDFTSFRDAGYDFSIDEMIKAKSYHLPAGMARTLHEAGFRYDLDLLIKLQSYHVPPDYMIAFKQAGYDLSADEIIKARSYHLDVNEAARLREAGYNFSLDELINLRSYHVPVEFIVQVHDPQYENFTARELIDFHQKRISVEAINKIRASKREAQP